MQAPIDAKLTSWDLRESLLSEKSASVSVQALPAQEARSKHNAYDACERSLPWLSSLCMAALPLRTLRCQISAAGRDGAAARSGATVIQKGEAAVPR